MQSVLFCCECKEYKIMIIIYIDIVLLIILLCLTVFTCGYCFYRVYRMQQNGEISILLRPTKVVFSHRKEGDPNGELRTVVAYQNPFTGDYCVHKSRVGPVGYTNALPALHLHSPDSGLSDEYEPLNLEPLTIEPKPKVQDGNGFLQVHEAEVKKPLTPQDVNTVNKTWHWNYTEYQI